MRYGEISSWQRFLPVVALLAAAYFMILARSSTEILPLRPALASFPFTIGEWHGTSLSMSQTEREVLGPGEFLLRNYQRSVEEPLVNLYMAYFPSQRTGDTIHSPQNCLPGNGWAPLEQTRVELAQFNGSSLEVNRYIVAQGANRELVYYWYQAHGRVTPSEYSAKIYLVMDSIRMNRTDGSMIRVITPIDERSGVEASDERVQSFTSQLIPLLDAYIPR
jgi:EpsI family protein